MPSDGSALLLPHTNGMPSDRLALLFPHTSGIPSNALALFLRGTSGVPSNVLALLLPHASGKPSVALALLLRHTSVMHLKSKLGKRQSCDNKEIPTRKKTSARLAAFADIDFLTRQRLSF